MKFIKPFLILACVIFAVSLPAQKIMRIRSNFVLLDSDQFDGKVGDLFSVYRYMDGQEVKIGQVKIVVIKNQLAAAQIVTQQPPFQFKKGDYIKSVHTISSISGNLETFFNANEFSKDIEKVNLPVKGSPGNVNTILRKMDMTNPD